MLRVYMYQWSWASRYFPRACRSLLGLLFSKFDDLLSNNHIRTLGQIMPMAIGNRHSLKLTLFHPLRPNRFDIVHHAQRALGINDHQRHFHFRARRLLALLRLALRNAAVSIVRATPLDGIRAREDRSILLVRALRLEVRSADFVPSAAAREQHFAEDVATHGLDDVGRGRRREERPVKVGDAGGGVGEGAPLLERGHDIDEDRGLEVWRRAGRGEEAVADAGATVVGDPVDWTGRGVGEDFFESFEDREADLAFIGGGGAGAYAVAWEFRDE